MCANNGSLPPCVRSSRPPARPLARRLLLLLLSLRRRLSIGARAQVQGFARLSPCSLPLALVARATPALVSSLILDHKDEQSLPSNWLRARILSGGASIEVSARAAPLSHARLRGRVTELRDRLVTGRRVSAGGPRATLAPSLPPSPSPPPPSPPFLPLRSPASPARPAAS